jgi:hypothetical protein
VTRRAEPAAEPRWAGRPRSFDEVIEGSGGQPTPPPGQRPTGPALPELREAARAIPPAIWAGRLSGGAAIELSFGRDLSVELRQGAGGLELSIRTAPALTRAAQVDLPALVRTLRGRGVEVVRAEVRGRPRGGDRGPGARSAR